MEKKGVFISMEGPDGSGKTTNVGFLRECLQEHGFKVVTTREPGGSPIAEELRRIILTQYMESNAELLLFAAARADHISKTIKPALDGGHVVLTDRFCDSTVAYQGYGRGLLEKVRELEQFVHAGFYPDFTLFFDIPFEECLSRLSKRTDKQDRIDQEAVEFKRRVWFGYQRQFNDNQHRMVRINALEDLPDVQRQIQNWVHNEFAPKHRHLQHYPR